jgi:phosphohistidine phosphatase
MAPALKDLNWHGQAVFCSQATRARLTIAGISEAFPDGPLSWQLDERLYTFSSSALLAWLRSLDDESSEVTMVGHNPAFTDLTDHLADADFDHLPTCAYVRLEADVDSWSSLDRGCARLCHFLKPKMLK